MRQHRDRQPSERPRITQLEKPEEEPGNILEQVIKPLIDVPATVDAINQRFSHEKWSHYAGPEPVQVGLFLALFPEARSLVTIPELALQQLTRARQQDPIIVGDATNDAAAKKVLAAALINPSQVPQIQRSDALFTAFEHLRRSIDQDRSNQSIGLLGEAVLFPERYTQETQRQTEWIETQRIYTERNTGPNYTTQDGIAAAAALRLYLGNNGEQILPTDAATVARCLNASGLTNPEVSVENKISRAFELALAFARGVSIDNSGIQLHYDTAVAAAPAIPDRLAS